MRIAERLARTKHAAADPLMRVVLAEQHQVLLRRRWKTVRRTSVGTAGSHVQPAGMPMPCSATKCRPGKGGSGVPRTTTRPSPAAAKCQRSKSDLRSIRAVRTPVRDIREHDVRCAHNTGPHQAHFAPCSSRHRRSSPPAVPPSTSRAKDSRGRPGDSRAERACRDRPAGCRAGPNTVARAGACAATWASSSSSVGPRTQM